MKRPRSGCCSSGRTTCSEHAGATSKRCWRARRLLSRMPCRRLAEAEDRLGAASTAAAANEAARARQAKALQTLEADAAEARARVRELEALSLQQSSTLQTRAQAECRFEETVRQLQQVRAVCICRHALVHCRVQSLCECEARASAADRAAAESAANLLIEANNREKLEAAVSIKDRQISSLMALNAR
jgi:hypothetical protein